MNRECAMDQSYKVRLRQVDPNVKLCEALRKFRTSIPSQGRHPSGAKAQRLFSATCGTAEAVPFQNFGHVVVFPQPVKPNIDLIGYIGPAEAVPLLQSRRNRAWDEFFRSL